MSHATTFAKPRNEAEFQRWVVALARKLGWMVYFTANSRRSPAGFPDLCLVKGDRIVFAELKTETGQLRDKQAEWLYALSKTACEVYIFRTPSWTSGEIEAILTMSRK